MKEAAAVILSSIFLLTACSAGGPAESIKLGAILPLTGIVSIVGTTFQQGIDLAVAEINQSGGVRGKRLQIIYEDDQSKPSLSVTSFQKLVSQDQVAAVVGPLAAQPTLAVAAITDKFETPTILSWVAIPDIAKDKKYAKSLWGVTAHDEAQIIFQELQRRKIDKIAIFTTLNDARLELTDTLAHLLESAGDSVAISERFNPIERDFRANILRLAHCKCDGLLINLMPTQISLAAIQIKEAGLKLQLFGNQVTDNPYEVAAAQGAMDGMWFPGVAYINEAFRAKFRDKYHAEPYLAVYGYDAIMILAQVIKESGLEREAITAGLNKIGTYHGVSGDLHFYDNGSIKADYLLKEIVAGEIKELHTQK